MSIDRGPEPAFLQSDLVKLAIEKMEEFYRSENRSQQRYDFPFNREIDEALKPVLRAVFKGKCGYCERKIAKDEDGVVDRFRPHSGVRERKEYFPDCYWWLTFKWENLIYCCKQCFDYKANYFPIRGKRAMTDTDNLELEDHLLFDPCNDLWEDFFSVYNGEYVGGKIHKADQTIELLRLNRRQLIRLRGDVLEELDSFIRLIDQQDLSSRAGLVREFQKNESQEFLNFVLDSMNRSWVFSHKDYNYGSPSPPMLAEEAITSYRPVQMVTNDFFPIEWVRIINFKGIADLTIDFKEDEPEKKSWLFLLGENGVGKSSILQAIAIGMQANEQMLAPVLPKLIRKGTEGAEITIKERNSDNQVVTLLTKDGIRQTGVFNSYLIGYGALRLSPDEQQEDLAKDESTVSYENLFRGIKPLNDITGWLKYIHQNNPTFFDAVAYSIKQLLPHDLADKELTVKDGEIQFKTSEKLFSHLSDGYKSTIILAVDIMMKLSSAQADMDKMTGIVLIDELGNQLHPRWQMRIVQQLRTVFKNLNFIISTHHPLCLRGAEQGEILLLKTVEDELVPVTDLPDPAALRVDQLLASEFFGLNSLIDPGLEATFNRYYSLLARERSISGKEREELFRLKDELRAQKQLGASLREELMYTVIDDLLASRLLYDKQPLNRNQLKAEVVKRVGELWKKINNQGDDQH